MAKILFIEDDPLIVKIYSTRLTHDGYQVISAEDGQDGLRLAESENPDLIILDIMMPRVDGFGVLTSLRQNPNLKDRPILVYSNLAQEGEEERARSLGATEFIIKANLSPTEMVEKIKQYLKK